VDEEVQLAIAWVLQRARELAPECDNAEEFLAAFGAPKACDQCGRLTLEYSTSTERQLVCDGCRVATKS
jgi:hypothetical protein